MVVQHDAWSVPREIKRGVVLGVTAKFHLFALTSLVSKFRV